MLALLIALASVARFPGISTQAVPTGGIKAWGDFPLTVRVWGVLSIAGLGMVGALLSGMPAVMRSDGTRNPFSLPRWQGLVKLPTGGVTAILGLIALRAEWIPGRPPESWAEVLVWAAAFGAAQQVITRLLDTRVQNLLEQPPPGGHGDEVSSINLGRADESLRRPAQAAAASPLDGAGLAGRSSTSSS